MVMILIGTLPLPAASLRWIHLGAIGSGMAGLAIDGKTAYQKMPPGKATPWGSVAPGLHRFRVASGTNSGSDFELDIAEDQMITLVSVSDKNGDVQCRTFGLDKAQGEIFVLNMLPGATMSLPESNQKAIFGKGFWLPDDKPHTTISLVDGVGFSGKVDITRLGDMAKGPYLAVICSNSDAKPSLAILRNHDSLFETGDKSVVVPGELDALIKVVSEGNDVAVGRFEPAEINWEEVKSRIFWFNLAIDQSPCRLEIGDFPAMRRMPSGRGSGFVKWPAGDWKTDVVVERTNEKVGSGNFSLTPSGSIGLISSGGGKHPHRLLTLEGRKSEESGSGQKSQIRFVNALPAGALEAGVQYDPQPVTIRLEPGKTSEIFPLENGVFPGATIDFALGAADMPTTRIPPMRPMPPGDWVMVVHLDPETYASPVLTWVEMDKGAITSPSETHQDE